MQAGSRMKFEWSEGLDNKKESSRPPFTTARSHFSIANL